MKFLRKGQKELNMIITLIILLVLAVVVISLILTFLKPENLKVGEQEVDLQKVKLECQNLCTAVSNAFLEDLPSKVWDYCKASFPIQKQEGFGDIIYKGPAGAESYCRTNAHCFNIEGAECYARGQKIGPEVCIEMMCKSLVEEGMNVREASDFIRKTMANSGSCGLRKGVTVKTKNGQEVIGVPTWWEKYFENPDCSKYVSPQQGGGTGGTGGGGTGSGCNAFCQSLNYSSATSDSCILINYCNSPNEPKFESDGAPCTGFEVCCCTP